MVDRYGAFLAQQSELVVNESVTQSPRFSLDQSCQSVVMHLDDLAVRNVDQMRVWRDANPLVARLAIPEYMTSYEANRRQTIESAINRGHTDLMVHCGATMDLEGTGMIGRRFKNLEHDPPLIGQPDPTLVTQLLKPFHSLSL